MAELLLDDFQVGAAGPIQVSRIAMATRVRGVAGIQTDSGHEALDHPPDPIAGEGPPLPNEYGGTVRDIFPLALLPRQEGLQVGFQFLGDEKTSRCFLPLPWRTTNEPWP